MRPGAWAGNPWRDVPCGPNFAHPNPCKGWPVLGTFPGTIVDKGTDGRDIRTPSAVDSHRWTVTWLWDMNVGTLPPCSRSDPHRAEQAEVSRSFLPVAEWASLRLSCPCGCPDSAAVPSAFARENLNCGHSGKPPCQVWLLSCNVRLVLGSKHAG